MMSRDPVVTRWHPPCALASADGAHVHSLHASLVGMAGADPVDVLDDGSGWSGGLRPGACLRDPLRDPPSGERLRPSGRGAIGAGSSYRRDGLVRDRGRILAQLSIDAASLWNRLGIPTDEDHGGVASISPSSRTTPRRISGSIVR